MPWAENFYDQLRYVRSPRAIYDCFYPLLFVFQYETQREMTVAAIAIKRYQLRTGKLPSTLSALLPEYVSQLPHDWMDGKPLRYRLNSDGTFTLYSVGVDGKDDGGDPTPTEGRSFYSLWDERDAVWPLPATPEEIAEAKDRGWLR